MTRARSCLEAVLVPVVVAGVMLVVAGVVLLVRMASAGPGMEGSVGVAGAMASLGLGAVVVGLLVVGIAIALLLPRKQK